MCVVRKLENERYGLQIVCDEDPEDPRTWDNLGTMVCWHNRYRLGDRHEFATPDEFLSWYYSRKDIVALPLYLMDHGGISMSTTSDSFRACDPAGWDWGQVGWIYIIMDRAREAFGQQLTEAELRNRAIEALKNEVTVYDAYLRGEVYGYVLESKRICDQCQHTEYQHEDSCFGFYDIADIKDYINLTEYFPEASWDNIW